MRHNPESSKMILDLLKLNNAQRISVDALLSVRELDCQDMKNSRDELYEAALSALLLLVRITKNSEMKCPDTIAQLEAALAKADEK